MIPERVPEITIPMEMIYTIIIIMGPTLVVGVWSLITMWFKIQYVQSQILSVEKKTTDIEKQVLSVQLAQSIENKELMRSMGAITIEVAKVQTMLRMIINRNTNLDDQRNEKHS